MNDTFAETSEMLENVAAILEGQDLPADSDDEEEEDED